MRLTKNILATIVLTLFTSLFIACSPTKITLDCNYMSLTEAMQRAEYENGKWSYDFNKAIEKIVECENNEVPYELELIAVTEIKEDIDDLDYVVKISIPDTVTEIWGFGFSRCDRLEYISVSKKNTKYCDENGLLYNAEKTELICIPRESKIKSLSIPNSVESAYIASNNLKKLKISKNLKTIYQIYGCTALEDISVDPENEVFMTTGDGILWTEEGILFVPEKYNQQELQIPNGITQLSGDTSEDLNIQVLLEKRLSNVKKINIPSSVEYIKINFFDNCDDYKYNIKTVNGSKFTSLEFISVDSDNNNYFSENGILFNKSYSEIELKKIPLNYEFKETNGEYVVPDFVTSIGAAAFSNCQNLKTVKFNKIKKIENAAFYGCSNLTEVFFQNSSEEIKTLELHPYAFAYTGLEHFEFTNYMRIVRPGVLGDGIWYAPGVFEGIFLGCENLKSVKLQELSEIDYDVTSENMFFFCENGFLGCESLETLSLPKNLGALIIEKNAFKNSSVEFIEFPGTKKEWRHIVEYYLSDIKDEINVICTGEK